VKFHKPKRQAHVWACLFIIPKSPTNPVWRKNWLASTKWIPGALIMNVYAGKPKKTSEGKDVLYEARAFYIPYGAVLFF